ncbi:MAG: phosphoribosylanthranilate isomerase, partial [Candidatus Limnocylindrales bacterium]
MTLTVPRRHRPVAAGSVSVVSEIAARRLADVRTELADRKYASLARRAAAAPPPRPVAERLAAPGCQLVAEVKRRSPSAGSIAGGDDLVARARAFEAGGAAAISVLCEPHWFDGSVGDLAAVRAAVGLPVLAKEFVVDPRQLPLLRAAGADLVLLLASLHPARRLRGLVRRAVDIGLEPLVEAHDERELDAALATEARLIGLNNRDLRSLAVDTEGAMRMRDLVPDDRLVIAESGVREAAMVAELRAAGFDAALVGEALMRVVHARATVEAFVRAGAVPDDPAAAARLPFVKICGVTDEAGVLACVRTGVDAIGLNLVAGTPRQLSLNGAAALARLARAAAPAGRAPRIVAVTADAPGAERALITATVAPDAIQLCGSEPPESLGRLARPAWKVLALPPGPVEGPEGEPAPGALSHGLAAATVERARAYRAAGAERILLDAAGGLHPGGTGLRISTDLAAAVAREVPVVLAGGLGPATVAEAVLAVPAVGVDASSGVEVPRVPGERPRKDALRVALFAKRARAARFDRPHISSRPTPVPQGLLEADERGRWGLERDFGG